MCWNVGMNDAKKPAISWYDGGSKSASVSTALTLNVWTHVAWVVSAGSVSIYVNGVSQALTGTTTLTNASQTLKIEIGVDRSRTWAGYLSNLRAVKGTALYTSNFTPPTTDLPIVSGTSLLLGTTNSVTDISTNGFALTLAGEVAANTTFAPHIPASINFDGTGDYLTINSASSFSLTADFTIEFYIRFSSFASYSTPFTLASGSGGGENYIQSDTSGGTSFSWGGWGGTNLSAGTGFALNTWYHLALCRSGSTIRSFRNGTQIASGTTSATIPTTGGFVYIGSQNSAQWFFNGNMSNIRVVKGTALYTSNFTPPTINLTNISNTSILLGQYQAFTVDFSGNGLTVTKSGDTTYSTSVLPF